MKLFNKIFLGAFALTSLSVLPACQEEESTIDGADAVYIELTPKSIDMCAGDTVRLSARISNVANDDIYSQIRWSVDDPSVAEIKQIDIYRWIEDPDYVAPDGSGEDTDVPGDGEGEGGETTEPTEPAEPDDPHEGMIKQFVESYLGIVAKKDAQGKSTTVRATLPNNKYGIAPVTVGYREIGEETIYSEYEYIRCYSRVPNSVVWFKLSPYSVIEDCDINFEIALTEELNMSESDEENHFRFLNENMRDNVVFDPENSRIGVMFTAPRGCGRGECTITLTTGDGSEASASCPVIVSPEIDGGLNVGGDPAKRPLPGPNNPSNVKYCLVNSTMDINSTLRIEACIGVPNNGHLDVANAYLGENGENPLMKWSIDGSVVLVEGQGLLFDGAYADGGYVSYIDIKSGIRTGNATIEYITPDTLMRVNLVVDDYNKTYPVESITVNNVWLDDNGDEQYDPISSLTTTVGENVNLAIIVYPEESYDYHKPVITIENPAIFAQESEVGSDGYVVRFRPLAVGSTSLHITALDKSIDFPVTVLDRVSGLRFANGLPSSVMVNGTVDLGTVVTMASGNANTTPVEFTSSDESVATVTLKPGTLDVAQVTGVAAGTATITAKAGDYTATYTITVNAAENIVIGDDFGELLIDAELFLMYGDREIEIFEPGVPGSDIVGSYSGTFTTPVSVDGQEYNDCEYSLTITAEGDGFRVVGWIQLTADIKIEINALFIQ